jgi:hypothetical protein
MSKKKVKGIESSTTPGHIMQVRSWLAELVMVRAHGNLPPYFWREQRWKWIYANELKAVTKFIKKFGETVVAKTVCDNRKIHSFAHYAELEYSLQREADAQYKLSLPKDTTPIKNEDRGSDVDLREPRSVVSKKGLFERLSELEHG